MSNLKITTGFMPFEGFQTYYRIVGDIQESYERGMAPLVLLHGGPGSTHNYFEVLDPIAETGRAVVMYDQLGCGESYVEGHDELWNKETWVRELIRLRSFLGLTEIHLLGQSWGGMLAITYLCDYAPEGIQSVILSSTLSDSGLWGREQHRQIAFMSPEDQAAIAETEKTGDYENPAYLQAVDHFMVRHCGAKPSETDPECLLRPKKSGARSYVVAWGPNEFTPQGNLADWNYTDKLGRITCPALIISGTNDLSTPLIAKTMHDHIPGSRWELFPGCRHACYVEATAQYIRLLKEWMES